MSKIIELEKARVAAVAKARESKSAADAIDAKAAGLKLADAIVEGAQSCPDCGSKPHGILQPMLAGKFKFHGYEIGCLSCRDHRVKGVTHEACVAAWNAGEYM